jgi:hypothetical protein
MDSLGEGKILKTGDIFTPFVNKGNYEVKYRGGVVLTKDTVYFLSGFVSRIGYRPDQSKSLDSYFVFENEDEAFGLNSKIFKSLGNGKKRWRDVDFIKEFKQKDGSTKNSLEIYREMESKLGIK